MSDILRFMAQPQAGQAVESVGGLVRYWRQARRLSQLALAGEAEMSARHLSFLETGRARPSREMVLRLAGVLDVPLRDRNVLLLAAGFAPMYTETALEGHELEWVRLALDALLRQQEPYPAIVMNRHWDVVASNAAASRFFGFLLGDAAGEVPMNVLRLMFHPRGLRPYVLQWPATAEALVRRIHREAVGRVMDDGTMQLLQEILSYPNVPKAWQQPDPGTAFVPVLPVSFSRAGRTFRFFSTVTTLGTPQDVTAQEIRVESFFPADHVTDRHARELAAEGDLPA